MIFSDSRYATAKVYKTENPKTQNNSIVVQREWPELQSNFFYYIWIEGDRAESVAARLLGDSNLWWSIMDFNPEIINPFSIPVGTILRIPYA